MFEQYTEKAAHVLKQAKKVSAELGQNYVGTEHILIALLREGGCAAAELLAERKVEESTVEELIRQLISPEGRAPSGAEWFYAESREGAGGGAAGSGTVP